MIRRHVPFTRSLAILFVVLVAAAIRWHEPHLRAILGTDEADYVRALSIGVPATYLGTRERSGIAFVSDVVAEYRRTGWARPFKHDWDADDAAGLRHYHPPAAMYPLGVTSWVGRDEVRLRVTPLVQGALAAGAASLLAFVLLAGAPRTIQLAFGMTAGLLTATSPYHAAASTEVGPHAAFSLVSTLVLIALSLAVNRRAARWWIAACGLTGLAMLTVPYWALLAPALLYTWWAGSFDGARTVRLGLRGIAAAALAATLAWPPFFLAAAFVKPVLMYVGIILRPLSHDQTPGVWVIELFRVHWALAVFGAVGLLGAGRLARGSIGVLLPSLIFVIGFVVVNLRVGHMKPLYVADAIAPIAALAAAGAGLALTRLPSSAARVAGGLSVILVLILGWPGDAPRDTSMWRPAFVTLNRELAGRRVLVTPRPAAAMVKYYLSGVDVIPDSSDSDDRPELDRALSARQIDTVLRWGATVEPGGAAAAVIRTSGPAGKVIVDGTTVSWWQP